jgi:hypothetical protein
MKAMKKYLALTLAFVLAFSFSATVLAAPVTDEGDVAPIEGSGDVEYLETEIYSVVLPTAAAFDFAVDPQGLLKIEDEMKLSDLSGGLIVQTGDVEPFINNSSVAIDLSVAVTATSTSVSVGDADLGVTWGTTAPTYTDGVRTGDLGANALDVLLYAQPADDDMGPAAAEYSGADVAYVLNGTTAAELDFYLEPATYVITYDEDAVNPADVYTIDIEAGSTGEGSALQIGGWVDTDDDWKNFSAESGTIGVSIVFSIAKAATAPASFEEGVFALTAASADLLTEVTPPAPAAPAAPAAPVYTVAGFIVDGTTASTTNITVSKSTLGSNDYEIPFFFGTGVTNPTISLTSSSGTTVYTAISADTTNNVLILDNDLYSGVAAQNLATVKSRTVKLTVDGVLYEFGLNTAD